jgi:polyphosphate kinase
MAKQTALKNLSPESKYINRELSWLKFNYRVLSEAANKNIPLLERARFLSIAANNLDEFFSVRVAGIYNQIKENVKVLSSDGFTPEEQLDHIIADTKRLLVKSNEILTNLKTDLGKAGIFFVEYKDLNANEKIRLNNFFKNNILPVLTPLIIDLSHPFPFIPNGCHFVMMILKRKKKKHKNKQIFSLILIPKKIQRFVNISNKKDTKRYISIENMMNAYAHLLFHDYSLISSTSARIIRDSDIAIEEEAEDLVLYLENALKKRKRGKVVKIEIQSDIDEDLKKFIVKNLEVKKNQIYEIEGFVGIHQIDEIYSTENKDYVFKPYSPRQLERLKDYQYNFFDTIKAKEFIVHHPYETFDSVIQFLTQAAEDPNVVAIKQTLYRTTVDSPIVKALTEAAENGKSVTAIVEIKARFDEEKNISLANLLEKSGVQVVYGFVKLKTHAKSSLVIRKEKNGLVAYAHIGTGNYHPINAKIYTDLSFFTCDKVITKDIESFFNYVTGSSKPKVLKKILLSPISLRPKLTTFIDQEIKNKKLGKPAEIWAKMNSLVDVGIIDKLYEASKAGVKIHLFVRGICCLKAGISGLSENIVVKSIIGRFLEHSRIYCFANGVAIPDPKNLVFIGSADLMTRNLDRRIEILIPVSNETVHEQVVGQIMAANYKDTTNSWILNQDGEYTKVKVNKSNKFSAHEYFMNNPSLSGRGKARGLRMPERIIIA